VRFFGWVGPRRVYYHDDFDQDLTTAGAEFHRLQQVWGGLRLRLAHDPAGGKNLGRADGTWIASVPAYPASQVPGLVVLYRFSDIELHCIRLRPIR
jgi:hypothetical protein